jgi:hypothetical protein
MDVPGFQSSMSHARLRGTRHFSNPSNPDGESFRILIAMAHSDLEVQIDGFDSFLESTPIPTSPNFQLIGQSNFPNVPREYKQLVRSLREDTHVVPPYSGVVLRQEDSLKMKKNFMAPPDNIPIHLGYLTWASPPLLDDMFRGTVWNLYAL